MTDRQRDSELAVVEGLWWTLDDQQLIKDVVMKGKYISNSIKFIANRNETSIETAKELFFVEVKQFVNNLIRNKQLHRASHVLKNVQLNEFYYLYDFYQVCKSSYLDATLFAIIVVFVIRKRKMRKSKVSSLTA